MITEVRVITRGSLAQLCDNNSFKMAEIARGCLRKSVRLLVQSSQSVQSLVLACRGHEAGQQGSAVVRPLLSAERRKDHRGATH